MVEIMNLFSDYTFQIVAMGAISLGILCGVAGTFAVLRKQSLLGDSIAHASLAGVALAFIITQSKNTSTLLLGALIFGIIAAAIIGFFSKNTRVNFESSLALVMSSLFGLGLVLLTQIQKMPNANQAGLEKFLFGQAATILKNDVMLTFVMMGIIVVITCLMYKELKVFSFDPIFTKTLGINTRILEFVLSSFVVASVITGIQMVGVVLISALLIIPSVAARQWTQRLSTMLILAALFGAIAGLMGTIFSSLIENLPTGPSIVIVASLVVMTSLLFAPQRGIINKMYRNRAAVLSYKADMVLIHHFMHHHHSLQTTFNFEDVYASTVEHHDIGVGQDKILRNLKKRNYIVLQGQEYQLTDTARSALFKQGGRV